MAKIYLRSLILTDEDNRKIYELKNCPANWGLTKTINYLRVKDSNSIVKRLIKFVDDDFKALLGFK